jgi:3-hydroxyisobutyrate dehydrogenase-like beta-hydroxyacid dehydrogenase
LRVTNLTIGVLHPGDMGSAVARQLTGRGHKVLYASTGRSTQTRARAEWAGMTDAVTIEALARDAEIVVSICPPHAATDVAGAVAATGPNGYRGLYVDANAVAPNTAREIGTLISGHGGDMVDGGIIGGPPEHRGTTRMYVSGAKADAVVSAFDGTALDVRVVPGDIGHASALKMCYAAWTKGTSALLLGIRAVAVQEGVDAALVEEWELSQPALVSRSTGAARAAYDKGWRWRGEMEEIAATFAGAGLPPGFHQAAAEVYARSPRPDGDSGAGEPSLEAMVDALLLLSGTDGSPAQAR